MAKSPSIDNDEGFDNPEDIFASLDDLLDGKLPTKKEQRASLDEEGGGGENLDFSIALDKVLGVPEADDSLTIEDSRTSKARSPENKDFSSESLSLRDLLDEETDQETDGDDIVVGGGENTLGFDPKELSLKDLLEDESPTKEAEGSPDESFSIDDILDQVSSPPADPAANTSSPRQENQTLAFSPEELSLQDLLEEEDDESFVVGGGEDVLGFDPKELSLLDLLENDDEADEDLSQPETKQETKTAAALAQDDDFSIDDLLDQVSTQVKPAPAPAKSSPPQTEEEFSIDDLIDQMGGGQPAIPPQKVVTFSSEELALDDLLEEEAEEEVNPVLANSKDLKQASTVAAEVTPSDTEGLKQAKPAKPAFINNDALERLDDVLGDIDPDSILEQVSASQPKKAAPPPKAVAPAVQDELELLDSIFDSKPSGTAAPVAESPPAKKPLPPLKPAAPPPPKEVENELESLDGWGLSAKPAKPEAPKKVPPLKNNQAKAAEESDKAEESGPTSGIEQAIRGLNQPLNVDKKKVSVKEDEKVPVLNNIMVHGSSRSRSDAGGESKKSTTSDSGTNELIERMTSEIHLKLSSQIEQHLKKSLDHVMQQAIAQVNLEIEPIIRQQIREMLPHLSQTRQG